MVSLFFFFFNANDNFYVLINTVEEIVSASNSKINFSTCCTKSMNMND